MARARLSRYRAKRDFKRTSEPSGRKQRARPAGALRFVVQKHAARRLHYDLRLELAGTFRSWAVTKGPSLDPGQRRLAVEVEDHPLDYGDFEGTIPKGEYGGGTVQLWDRGFWAPLPGVDAQKALKAGSLKFLLMGERLQGEWVLVRMKRDRSGGKRTNWLLIKHRDRYARKDGDALLRKDRSIASDRRMADITAGRGARPRPFMKAAQPRPPGPARRREPKHRTPQPCRVTTPAIRGAATRATRPVRAAGSRLGARDQVRRLPDADARGRRQGHSSHPQGTRLDAPLRRNRRRGRNDSPIACWMARSWPWTSAACRVSPPCRPRSSTRIPPDSCTSYSTCCTRTGRTCEGSRCRCASNAWRNCSGRHPRASPALRGAFRDRSRGGPEVRMPDVAGGRSVQAPRRSLSVRAGRHLAEDQVSRGT